VRALYLGMSTLTMEQLARELARDPVTRHQTWNAARVDRVLAQTGTTSAHRDRALAERVRAAVDAGEPAGLPELVERIAAAHPGFNEAILWRLAGDHPAVARALDRHLGHHPPVVTSPETPPPLGLAQARALYREADVGAKSMALVLAGSPALPRWMKPIRDAETVDGNGDGVLARKDLANASPATLRPGGG
jgi:hypothetical protein